MIELISLMVFLYSLVGIIVIIYKKIPLLKNMPKAETVNFNWKNIFSKLQNSSFWEKSYFNINVFLQKTLSKIKILTLKIENKVSLLLQKLREHSQKKKK